MDDFHGCFVRLRHRMLHKAAVLRIISQMKVGNLHDAVSVERGCDLRGPDLHLVYLENITPPRCTPYDQSQYGRAGYHTDSRKYTAPAGVAPADKVIRPRNEQVDQFGDGKGYEQPDYPHKDSKVSRGDKSAPD